MSNFSFKDWYSFTREHVLRDFQNDLLDSSFANPFTAVLGARQIGKTRYLAMLALLLAGGVKTKHGSIPAHNVYIISSTYDKAQNVIKEVQLVLKEMDLIAKISHDVLGGKTTAALKNGMTIMAVAGRPGCLQGFAGSCLWDEASLTDHDPSDIYTQILAASSAEPYYRVVLCTNADRIGSWTWEFFHSPMPEWVNIRKEFDIHDVNIYNAYPDGIPEHIERRQRMMTASGWKRFYLNQFVSGDQGRFEAEIINLSVSQVWNCKDGIRVLSIDPGFSVNGHPAGVTVGSISGGRLEVLYADLWCGLPETEQREKIEALVSQYSVSRIIVDQGVGGMIMRDNLIRRYGKHMVVPISVTKNKYSLWCTELERLMTEGRLNIQASHKCLIDDLRNIEVDARGNIKIPEIAHPNGTNRTHCDAGVSLLYMLDSVGGTASTHRAEQIEIGDTEFGWDTGACYDKFI